MEDGMRFVAQLALGSLALTFPLSQSECATQARAAYEGAARIYSFEQVVVVHPSTGPAVDEARQFALRAADFLERTHGVTTRVVSDDAVDASVRTSNLLILGWNNLLFGEFARDLPVERQTDGWRFIDGIGGLAEDDLLFSTRSPFSAEHWIAFWSRVDCELGRFNPLPFVGSDWVIFRDFSILAQGNFLDSGVWPPKRNPEAERDRRVAEQAVVERLRAEHVVLYASSGSLDDPTAVTIVETRQAALKEAARLLAVSLEGYRASVHVYTDVAEKEDLSGVPDVAHALGRRRELHVTLRGARMASPHEEIHLLARERWGPCHLTALYEGLPHDLEGSVLGIELALHAARLAEEDAIPTLGTLLNEESFRALGRTVAAPAAGMLVRWLRQTSSPETWTRLYGRLSLSAQEIAAAIGLESAAAAEAAFADSVRALGAPAVAELAFRRAIHDAKLCRENDDRPGLIAALLRAHTLRPADSQLRLDLASARLLGGDPAGALSDLQPILDEPRGEARQYIVTFALLQKARALDLLGERARALEVYQSVLDRTDEFGFHDAARMGLEQAATQEGLTR
jgi:hypothetical protein